MGAVAGRGRWGAVTVGTCGGGGGVGTVSGLEGLMLLMEGTPLALEGAVERAGVPSPATGLPDIVLD